MMGLNIYIVKADGQMKDHPDWDSSRWGGDRQLPSLWDWDNLKPDRELEWGDGDFQIFRPIDFAKFRATDWPKVNPDRWALMCDILEQNPEYGIYISV